MDPSYRNDVMSYELGKLSCTEWRAGRGRDLLFVLSCELLIVLHSELLKLSLLQVEHCLVQATFIHGADISTRRVHQLQAFVEEILNENFLVFDKKDCLSVTRMADMAATMAGVLPAISAPAMQELQDSG